ncbi:uncharacterized protein LOC106083613 isoform X1 [Stomoxys calcitrans]|uniref:Dynactin subunit 3 n=1 Tax=Stomoxys calcitrans TaxID=35570 RepID=A0A1I8NWF2_STOCA|nr:uncharacterized protein LOC106083613 isoform X1 [Stomoxys calcitrans]
MEALDILEKRVDTLTRILGVVPDNGMEGESSKVTASGNVIDSLVSANNIVNEAISGREKIKTIVDRSEELEAYLDPHFLEENQQVRAKEVYLNAVANDLHTQFQQLDRIKELEPTLGAEYFRNIPGECVDKLKQVNEDNTEFAQQAELIEESLILAMKRYGEIQKGLMDSLAVMNKRLEAVEEKLQQNKKEQMEKELPTKEGN